MLAGGTMGWWSAQRPLVAGAEPQAPPRSPARAADRAAAAATLRERFGLAAPMRLAEWERTTTPADRTTYLLDVRDPAEHRAAHLPGSRPAPSWELVPKAFAFVAVLRATIVLVDDAPGLRGLLTASWLLRMGWRDVRVVALEPEQLALLPPSDAVPPPARARLRAMADPDRAAAFDAYLGWEQGLVAQLARDETTPLRGAVARAACRRPAARLPPLADPVQSPPRAADDELLGGAADGAVIRAAGPATASEPIAAPLASKIGAATATAPGWRSALELAQPRLRILASCARSSARRRPCAG